MAKKTKGKKPPDDLRVPPWLTLPASFYRSLANYAEKFGLTRAEFLQRSIHTLARELSDFKSPAGELIGREGLEKLRQLSSKAASDYWKTVPPEERKRRASEAAKRRWGKKNGPKDDPTEAE